MARNLLGAPAWSPCCLVRPRPPPHCTHKLYARAAASPLQAISQDADSAKGFFRRGIAYRHLNNLQRSISDLGTAHRLKRTDKRINDELVTSQRLLDEQNAAMKSGLAKFFG